LGILFIKLNNVKFTILVKLLMKILFFFIALFVSSHCIRSQNYNKVDELIRNYPSRFNDIDVLADRIDNDFKSDEEKTRAIYSWLTLNIRYDYLSDRIVYFDATDLKRQRKKGKLKRLEKVLRNGKAICLDYSELFKEVCDRMGVKSKIVLGFSKIYIDEIENAKKYKDHSWNVVKINDTWKLIDITWGSSLINHISKENFENLRDYYFFTNPDEFILTHFPGKLEWQLVENKLTKEEFFKNPILYPNYFNGKIKLANFQKGLIRTKNKRIQIYFDTIPKREKFFYALEGDKHIKPIDFKRTKDGKFVTSIKYRDSNSSNITIYSNLMPVASFKVLSSLDQ